MRLVIIESPYQGDLERNRIYLDRCIRDCLARGESPYASHRMLTSALDDAKREEREAGIMAGFAWRRVAEATVIFADYGVSNGMLAGLEDAVAELHRAAHTIEVRRIGLNPEPARQDPDQSKP